MADAGVAARRDRHKVRDGFPVGIHLATNAANTSSGYTDLGRRFMVSAARRGRKEIRCAGVGVFDGTGGDDDLAQKDLLLGSCIRDAAGCRGGVGGTTAGSAIWSMVAAGADGSPVARWNDCGATGDAHFPGLDHFALYAFLGCEVNSRGKCEAGRTAAIVWRYVR